MAALQINAILPPTVQSPPAIHPTRSVGASGSVLANPVSSTAVLAISIPVNLQPSRLSAAMGSANDTVSLLQTAQDALGAVKDNLLSIRNLALQAASTPSSIRQRAMLQGEVADRVAEIDRISQAQVNGIRLFESSRTNVVGDPSLLAVLNGLKGGWLENAEQLIRTYYGLKADGAPLSIGLNRMSDGPDGVAASVSAMVPSAGSGQGTDLRLDIDRADFLPAGLPNGGNAPLYGDRIIAHELTHAVMARTTNYANLSRTALWFVEGTAEFIHGADERLVHDLAQAGGKAQVVVDALADETLSTSMAYSASYAAVRYLHDQIKSAGGEGIKEVMGYLFAHRTGTLDDAFREAVAPLGGPVGAYRSVAAFLHDFKISGAGFILSSMNLANADTGAIGGQDADGGAIRTAESVVPDAGTHSGDNALVGFAETFEAVAAGKSRSTRGSSAYRASSTAMASAMNASALGVNALNLLDDPADAVGQATRALEYVNSERSRIGAQATRMSALLGNYATLLGGVGAAWNTGAFSIAGLAALIGSTIRNSPGTAVAAQAHVAQSMALHLLEAA